MSARPRGRLWRERGGSDDGVEHAPTSLPLASHERRTRAALAPPHARLRTTPTANMQQQDHAEAFFAALPSGIFFSEGGIDCFTFSAFSLGTRKV